MALQSNVLPTEFAKFVKQREIEADRNLRAVCGSKMLSAAKVVPASSQ
jgi:hypothetical protein